MRIKETGGPAFPTDNAHQSAVNIFHEEGMTLRDYFAAKAMGALLAVDGTNADYFPTRAREAYMMADAMIEARK